MASKKPADTTTTTAVTSPYREALTQLTPLLSPLIDIICEYTRRFVLIVMEATDNDDGRIAGLQVYDPWWDRWIRLPRDYTNQHSGQDWSNPRDPVRLSTVGSGLHVTSSHPQYCYAFARTHTTAQQPAERTTNMGFYVLTSQTISAALQSVPPPKNPSSSSSTASVGGGVRAAYHSNMKWDMLLSELRLGCNVPRVANELFIADPYSHSNDRLFVIGHLSGLFPFVDATDLSTTNKQREWKRLKSLMSASVTDAIEIERIRSAVILPPPPPSSSSQQSTHTPPSLLLFGEGSDTYGALNMNYVDFFPVCLWSHPIPSSATAVAEGGKEMMWEVVCKGLPEWTSTISHLIVWSKRSVVVAFQNCSDIVRCIPLSAFAGHPNSPATAAASTAHAATDQKSTSVPTASITAPPLPMMNGWSELPGKLREVRWLYGVCCLGDRLFVFGGRLYDTTGMGPLLDTIEWYNDNTDEWVQSSARMAIGINKFAYASMIVE